MQLPTNVFVVQNVIYGKPPCELLNQTSTSNKLKFCHNLFFFGSILMIFSKPCPMLSLYRLIYSISGSLLNWNIFYFYYNGNKRGCPPARKRTARFLYCVYCIIKGGIYGLSWFVTYSFLLVKSLMNGYPLLRTTALLQLM